MNNKTKKKTTLAVLCAISYVVMVMGRIPHTLSGAVIGLGVGSVAMVAVMLLWNYLITPLYMGYPREAVVELLLPAFLPFNALKAGLNAAFTFLLYKPITTALRRSGYISLSEKEHHSHFSVGLILLAVMIIVSCILFILSMNGIFALHSGSLKKEK